MTKLTKAQEKKIRDYCDRMNLVEEDAIYFIELLADELAREREKIINQIRVIKYPLTRRETWEGIDYLKKFLISKLSKNKYE